MNSHILYGQDSKLAMNLLVIIFLAIILGQFVIPSTIRSLSVYCIIFSPIDNQMIGYIPSVYGELMTDSQKQNIMVNIINGSIDSVATVGSSSNNKADTEHSNQNWNINIINLLIDSAFSVYRMFSALGLSFLAALTIGIITARKPFASKIIIPIVDILQSVPILGFFPAAIALFITLFNGSPIGIELAAIFLIFTSMVWNMIFSVYESVLSIPSELLETSHVYGARRLLRLRRLYLPASIPKLTYNAMLSWAGGWYFITAAEIIALGAKTFSLPGLGSLLGHSVSSGQYIQAVIALATLIVIIMLTDFFFWRPLESYANRFRYDYSSTSLAGSKSHHRRRLSSYLYNENMARYIFRGNSMFSSSPPSSSPIRLSNFLIRNPRPLLYIKSNKLIQTFAKIIRYPELHLFAPIHRWFDKKRNLRIFEIIAIALLALVIILLVNREDELIYKSFSALSNMYLSLYNDPQSNKIVSQIPLALLLSYLRLAAAYFLSLAWTIPVAIKIANNRRFDRIMPIFQTFAAIPAPAFFPFMIMIVSYIPGGFEFLSILLILTGMQWYILFNLIGGVRSISGDVQETARAFRATKSHYVKRVLFPSMYPSLITGSITGWGGGWNSLIVAEYLVFGSKTYSVLGMGSLLDQAAYSVGNTILVLLIVGVMSSVIVLINRLVWRRIYRNVIRKYSMSG